ncbi:MAG: hypothetical protein CSA81_00065 [Acidobacteria bacterium]|nr:MAG: hypothetical protein CSA81_00065 [Acidobacteriota bacterium]PIE91596.1 MAG: hypothetical protein CR997_00135 [Acidobacteriota bacterium]
MKPEVKAHIAILEDEELIRSMIQINLENRGYAVEPFSSGEDLINHQNAEFFDLYVLDLMLPGLSGREVTERLRKAGVHNPIIMVTAKSDVDSCLRNLSQGADDYLMKPFDMDELIMRIEVLLRRTSTLQCPVLNQTRHVIV